MKRLRDSCGVSSLHDRLRLKKIIELPLAAAPLDRANNFRGAARLFYGTHFRPKIQASRSKPDP
jgi:hypothetical protein